MSEHSSQPDLQDRQLIPARSRVSLSREIGDAVITETIFGNARVRIIRKNDKFHRAMWLLALAGAGIVAAAAWQGWVSSRQSEAMPDVETILSSDAVAMPASQAEASPTIAAPALESVPPITPPQAAPISPVQNAVPAAVAPAKPVFAPRPVIVKPQSAPQPTGLLAQPQFATSLPPKPVFVKPQPSKPAVAATAASSPVIAMPLSSPLAKESVPATGDQTVEPGNLQSK
jgi:hypothetical protein